MAKIIYSHTGNFFQVPGLPYEQDIKYVNSIVFDDVPSKGEIEQILAASDEHTLTNPWTVDVVRGFGNYIPTTFRRIAEHMDGSLFEEFFGLAYGIPEERRVLLQLQTEIEAKSATIDAAIVHWRRDLGTVVNKAHVANRLYLIGRLYEHLHEREYPFLFGDLTDESRWDEALSAMKLQFIEYMLEVPVGPRIYPVQIRESDVSQDEIKRRFPYVEWLKEKLGDDLMGILLYGSAARTQDPGLYSDFDNWVRVRDIDKAHKVLRGTNPQVLGSQVIEGVFDEIKDSKHLGIHLLPESDEYMMRHVRFLHDSEEFLRHTRVLMGEFPFIKVAEDEIIERGLSQAYVKLKTIHGSLNWAYSAPQRLYGKPALYEFIVKNMRFFLQHAMNAMYGPDFRDKEMLNAILEERGLPVPVYRDDLQHIRDSLVHVTRGVFTLQKELMEHNRAPNLDFLVGTREGGWEIDNWAPYDDE